MKVWVLYDTLCINNVNLFEINMFKLIKCIVTVCQLVANCLLGTDYLKSFDVTVSHGSPFHTVHRFTRFTVSHGFIDISISTWVASWSLNIRSMYAHCVKFLYDKRWLYSFLSVNWVCIDKNDILNWYAHIRFCVSTF